MDDNTSTQAFIKEQRPFIVVTQPDGRRLRLPTDDILTVEPCDENTLIICRRLGHFVVTQKPRVVELEIAVAAAKGRKMF